MKIIYLAGQLTGRSKKDAIAERNQAAKLLKKAGFLVFDPLSIESSDKYKGPVFPKNPSNHDMRIYVRKEKNAIENCHAVLLLTGDVPSDGSWLEMGFALYKCRIPVVLISKLRSSGELVSWSNVEASSVVPNMQQAVTELTRLLNLPQYNTKVLGESNDPKNSGKGSSHESYFQKACNFLHSLALWKKV